MGNASSAAAGQSDLLKIEQVGAVLTVGLNRPAKRNALNDGIILAIQDCFSNLPENTGAVVIHGIGDHFSSGLDLSEMQTAEAHTIPSLVAKQKAVSDLILAMRAGNFF